MSDETREVAVARARADGAEGRAAFRAGMGGALAASLEDGVTLDYVARLAVSSIADFCLVDVVEADAGLRRVVTAHRDPQKAIVLAQALASPPDAGRGPLARPLRTGEPLLLPALTDSDLGEIAPAGESKRLLVELGVRSLLSLPLLAHEPHDAPFD